MLATQAQSAKTVMQVKTGIKSATALMGLITGRDGNYGPIVGYVSWTPDLGPSAKV